MPEPATCPTCWLPIRPRSATCPVCRAALESPTGGGEPAPRRRREIVDDDEPPRRRRARRDPEPRLAKDQMTFPLVFGLALLAVVVMGCAGLVVFGAVVTAMKP